MYKVYWDEERETMPRAKRANAKEARIILISASLYFVTTLLNMNINIFFM